MTKDEMQHWFDNLTDDEQVSIALVALNNLHETDATEVIKDWALMNGASDELILELENDA